MGGDLRQESCESSFSSPSGLAFDVPLLTISSSYLYLPDFALRHCPPVSGWIATLLIGDLPKYSGPRTVSILRLAILSRTDLLFFGSAAPFSAAIPTSHSECEIPSGWVHRLPVDCSYSVASSCAL